MEDGRRRYLFVCFDCGKLNWPSSTGSRTMGAVRLHWITSYCLAVFKWMLHRMIQIELASKWHLGTAQFVFLQQISLLAFAIFCFTNTVWVWVSAKSSHCLSICSDIIIIIMMLFLVATNRNQTSCRDALIYSSINRHPNGVHFMLTDEVRLSKRGQQQGQAQQQGIMTSAR